MNMPCNRRLTKRVSVIWQANSMRRRKRKSTDDEISSLNDSAAAGSEMSDKTEKNKSHSTVYVTPLTAAERQRRRREKIAADPVALREFKAKECARWHQRVQSHKVKLIGDLTPREQRHQRRRWRRQWQERVKNKSPTVTEITRTPSTPVGAYSAAVSRQWSSGRKQVRRDRSRAYKRINQLEAKLAKSVASNNMLRKRLSRIHKFNSESMCDTSTECVDNQNTPRKSARRLMASPRKNARALIYHCSLLGDLRARLKHMRGADRRVAVSVFCAAKLLKKHRLMSAVRRDIGLRPRGQQVNNKNKKLKRSRFAAAHSKRNVVQAFFEQDDVSRSTSGKKETVTKNKVKKQKRFLLQPVCELYKRFCAIHPDIKMSQSAFALLKPFWVKKPRIQDRDTCLCKLHENTRLMHEKLRQIKLIPSCSVEDVVRHIVCNREVTNRLCMTNACTRCKNRSFPFMTTHSLADEPVSWYQWQSVRIDVDDKKQVRKTVKQIVRGSVNSLKTSYVDAVKLLKPHMFTISNQYSVVTDKKQQLTDKEVIIHIDFSENWTVKSVSEVQSAHFGSSLRQITLHTGVAYFSHDRHMPFCSLSDSTDHGPAAIWSHLIPVLINIRENYDDIEILHVVSDGPTTQYRNRKNFYLCTVIPPLFDFRFTWWNFSEASHGKGPADGVGAAIKRLADRCVLSGEHITDASSLKCALERLTHVKLFLINNFVTLSDDENIPPFPGTMEIHQLLAEPTGRVSYRRFSCYCSATRMCACIKPRTVYVGDIDKSCVTLQLPSCETHKSVCEQIEQPNVYDESNVALNFTENCTGTVVNVAGMQYIVLQHGEQVTHCLPVHLITEAVPDSSAFALVTEVDSVCAEHSAAGSDVCEIQQSVEVPESAEVPQSLEVPKMVGVPVSVALVHEDDSACAEHSAAGSEACEFQQSVEVLESAEVPQSVEVPEMVGVPVSLALLNEDDSACAEHSTCAEHSAAGSEACEFQQSVEVLESAEVPQSVEVSDTVGVPISLALVKVGVPVSLALVNEDDSACTEHSAAGSEACEFQQSVEVPDTVEVPISLVPVNKDDSTCAEHSAAGSEVCEFQQSVKVPHSVEVPQSLEVSEMVKDPDPLPTRQIEEDGSYQLSTTISAKSFYRTCTFILSQVPCLKLL